MPSISVKHDNFGRFIERRLEDDLLLYDTFSGETHLIAPPVLVLFEILRDHSGTSSLLAREMAHHLDGTEQEVQNFVDRTLASLQDIGLIEIKEFL
ncbi:HPr-rel-A system PqqD family peptide chaperone [Ferribacterium limneticum]|uniref:HPr-rel-A system PqqD family peptide chaperone n=1 Tax=Ferribacterium limneticum TaxID=76259 RepID=UPI001CF817FA|nr:HPr-rel-A system PqqD family peptide chaperone [Ferribacterium limneticum]UCV24704.1 HPr-rel-A system PqqD family peptide chaperone [Ferribacterium limneticum]